MTSDVLSSDLNVTQKCLSKLETAPKENPQSSEWNNMNLFSSRVDDQRNIIGVPYNAQELNLS